jgi:peptidyl-prolyl cis-trans isomerase SurA
MKRAATKRALCLLLLSACGGEEQAAQPTAPPSEPEAAPVVEAPPPDPNEACARVVVVAWRGAPHAAATVTRSEEEARARAEQIRGRVSGGEDIAAVARADSDAASSGPRGGLLGTYLRDEWPEAHVPIRDGVFALRVGETSEVLRAPYGFVVAQRCAVEKIHTRHILIRFAGARNAGEEITRTQAEARALAEDIRGQASRPGADFAALAREHSEDGSAEQGGDVGTTGRGRLAQAYEDAAYALAPNAIAPVVETEFGFHVIQRLPDE